jgi:hypothetical protein
MSEVKTAEDEDYVDTYLLDSVVSKMSPEERALYDKCLAQGWTPQRWHREETAFALTNANGDLKVFRGIGTPHPSIQDFKLVRARAVGR